MNILCLFASPSPTQSVSRQAAESLIQRLRSQTPGGTVKIRNLADQPPPHWGAAEVAAAFTPPADRDAAAISALGLSDALCAELAHADVVVVASPMWNFSVPSCLKAWIDHVVRVGVTFKYGAQGPIGLLTGLRTVYVVEATGGTYLEAPARELNHVGPYLTQVFRFLGAQDVVTITAPGTAVNRAEALRHANAALGVRLPVQD